MGFLVFAGIAIGYALWSVYGSGETLAEVDVIAVYAGFRNMVRTLASSGTRV